MDSPWLWTGILCEGVPVPCACAVPVFTIGSDSPCARYASCCSSRAVWLKVAVSCCEGFGASCHALLPSPGLKRHLRYARRRPVACCTFRSRKFFAPVIDLHRPVPKPFRHPSSPPKSHPMPTPLSQCGLRSAPPYNLSWIMDLLQCVDSAQDMRSLPDFPFSLSRARVHSSAVGRSNSMNCNTARAG